MRMRMRAGAHAPPFRAPGRVPTGQLAAYSASLRVDEALHYYCMRPKATGV
jgi:hypothetical protein